MPSSATSSEQGMEERLILILTNMEAKELMIGDWVSMRLPNGKYIADDQLMSVDAVKEGRLIVKPIPLTEEILKLNGFKAEYAHEDYRYKDEMLLTQSYDKKGFWWVVGNMYVCLLLYVHELQHTLRLCGLKDLADNFKIE